MPDRTINWGDPADAGTKYRTQDDDPAGGGNFVVAEDLNGNTVLLQYNPTAGQWEYGGPVDMGGNDISNAGTISADALEADDGIISNVVLNQSDVGNVTTYAANRVTVAGDTYQEIFNLSNSADVIGGSISGVRPRNLRITWGDGTVDTFGTGNHSGEDTNGNDHSTKSIPAIKDVKKLEFENGSGFDVKFGWEVFTV